VQSVVDRGPCKNLTHVNLNETKVSDAVLAQLKDCKNLTIVNVQKTKVTAAGVDKLKKALPQCKIEWDVRLHPSQPHDLTLANGLGCLRPL
jgi:hypothetical protein